MNHNEYAVAGWLAIAAAVLSLPMLLLSIAVDVMRIAGTTPVLMPVHLAVTGLQLTFALYALGRFRHLLNARFEYHAVDRLIGVIIAGAILLTVVLSTGRLVAPAGEPHPLTLTFIAATFAVGVPLAVISIVFALRLKDLESDLSGYKNSFVFTKIAASVCFATLILAPVGLLFDAIANVLLGLIFLKPGADASPEFV